MVSATAAILIGGLGTRLRSLVADRPKVLAQVRGRPFLAYVLDQVAATGVRDVVLCTGYLGGQVREQFGDAYGALRLVYSQESSPLGTGGALRLALPGITSDTVLVMNGDSFYDIDLRALWDWHAARPADATLALVRMRETSRYGRVQVDEHGRVVRFDEKPGGTNDPPTCRLAEGEPTSARKDFSVLLADDRRGDEPGWVNAGIYLLNRSLLQRIPADRMVSLEHEMFPSWVASGLYGYRPDGRFLDIGTPEAYTAAQQFAPPPVCPPEAGLPFRHVVHPDGSDQTPSNHLDKQVGGRRFVVLDRDGTLIVERHYLADPAEVELIEGAGAALRNLSVMGLGVVVVTNQSAVGRGLIGHARLEQIHSRLHELLAAEGVRLEGIYACPHTPDDGCRCRKPRTGLIELAMKEWGFEGPDSFVIGDKACDVEMGRRVGATTLLVRTGYGVQVAAEGNVTADYVIDSVADALPIIQRLLERPARTVVSVAGSSDVVETAR